jgi:hypothetical protein
MKFPIRILSRSTKNGVRLFRVSSETVPGKSYSVVLDGKKRTCGCKRWIFRHARFRRMFLQGKISAEKMNREIRLFRCKHIKKASHG